MYTTKDWCFYFSVLASVLSLVVWIIVLAGYFAKRSVNYITHDEIIKGTP